MSFDLNLELRTAIEHWEGLYGPRDQKFRILDVSFHDLPYAQTLVNESAATIAVKLHAAVTEDLRLKYQIWHEAVHCVAPTARMDTLWFEEGLAVKSALNAPFMDRNYRRLCIKELKPFPDWFAPYEAFKRLKATSEQILAVRNLEPQRRFDLLDQSSIREIFNTSEELANELCKRVSFTREAPANSG